MSLQPGHKLRQAITVGRARRAAYAAAKNLVKGDWRGAAARFGGEPHSVFPYPRLSAQRVSSFVRIASLAAAP